MDEPKQKMETFITNVLEIPYDHNKVQTLLTAQGVLQYAEEELMCIIMQIHAEERNVLQRDTSSSIAQNMELRRKIVTKNTSRFVYRLCLGFMFTKLKLYTVFDDFRTRSEKCINLTII